MMLGAGALQGLGQGMMSPEMRNTYNAASGGYGDLYRMANAATNLEDLRRHATRRLSPMDEVEALRAKSIRSRANAGAAYQGPGIER
jgi:hypothetical protein